MIRTRFAPSPTGYMHIGNLRTALYTYLVAKSKGGTFILRIEDTDKNRQVDDSIDVIYNTLNISGLKYDEGPKVGGDYGPYIQSERKNDYMTFAKELVEKGEAYYCFCSKERLESLTNENDKDVASYDRHCTTLSKEEIEKNLNDGVPFVIRQFIKEGSTTFTDEVYGEITVDNSTLDDQILIKADGYPTYNFANVVDDNSMNITHVIRGSEYLSSTPKYNLLYDAFGYNIPKYIHLPLIQNESGEKLSKRRGDASFEDLLAQGFLPEAIINYIALLGWSPSDNNEIFTLNELTESFDIKGISKSPSKFDIKKLEWLNTEYFKKMDLDTFFEMANPILKDSINSDIDLKYVANLVKSRITFLTDIPELVDFIDNTFNYDKDLFLHKKMKTTHENSLVSLQKALPLIESIDEKDFEHDFLADKIFSLVKEMEIKNGVMLWPLRTALSCKPTSPCGAFDLLCLLGKEESIRRIKAGIALLEA